MKEILLRENLHLCDLVKILKIRRTTLELYIREGILKAKKVGRMWVIDPITANNILKLRKIDIFCINCGKKIDRESKAHHSKKFCSDKCYRKVIESKHRSEKGKKTRLLNYIKNAKEFRCLNCGKTFFSLWGAKKGRKTCSTICCDKFDEKIRSIRRTIKTIPIPNAKTAPDEPAGGI